VQPLPTLIAGAFARNQAIGGTALWKLEPVLFCGAYAYSVVPSKVFLTAGNSERVHLLRRVSTIHPSAEMLMKLRPGAYPVLTQ
jgi:hypothetical protein